MPADAVVSSVSVHASLSLRVLNSSTDRGERGRALRSSASRPDGGTLRLLMPPGAHTEAAETPSPHISYLRAVSLCLKITDSLAIACLELQGKTGARAQGTAGGG